MKAMSQGLPSNSSTRLVAIQRLLDPLLIIGLFLFLSRQYNLVLTSDYLLLSVITYLLSLLAFKVAGRYRADYEQTFTWEMPRIVTGWVILLALVVPLGYLARGSFEVPFNVLVLWGLTVPIGLYLLQVLIQSTIAWFRHSGYSGRTAVVVGYGELGRHLSEQIRNTSSMGIQLCGFFDDRFPIVSDLTEAPSRDLLGKVDRLTQYVRHNRIDMVFITPPISDERLSELIADLQDTTACVYFLPNISMFNLMQARVHQLNGLPLVAVWENPFYDLQSDLKRLLDIVVAMVAMVVFGPIMVLCAIAVKLSSPGPILFKQRRHGLNGQDIMVYKFRTMTVMEDGDQVKQAEKGDKRITKVGAFLRKTSLDELPQFINVLQGRMSVVGPRPHAVAHNERYRKLISGYMLRHKVKPGITGWAQVHGFRGETDTLEKMRKRVEYDLEYFQNWSLGLDLQIIFRTALVFFHSPNAY
jgi:putative colanic acid biosysnthesis UDP-glucose lipid carrier transferase